MWKITSVDVKKLLALSFLPRAKASERTAGSILPVSMTRPSPNDPLQTPAEPSQSTSDLELQKEIPNLTSGLEWKDMMSLQQFSQVDLWKAGLTECIGLYYFHILDISSICWNRTIDLQFITLILNCQPRDYLYLYRVLFQQAWNRCQGERMSKARQIAHWADTIII
jgi:hypothetical protein